MIRTPHSASLRAGLQSPHLSEVCLPSPISLRVATHRSVRGLTSPRCISPHPISLRVATRGSVRGYNHLIFPMCVSPICIHPLSPLYIFYLPRGAPIRLDRSDDYAAIAGDESTQTDCRDPLPGLCNQCPAVFHRLSAIPQIV